MHPDKVRSNNSFEKCLKDKHDSFIQYVKWCVMKSEIESMSVGDRTKRLEW